MRTALALAVAWPLWLGALWVQERVGLDWLGLVFPGAVLVVALGGASRALDQG